VHAKQEGKDSRRAAETAEKEQSWDCEILFGTAEFHDALTSEKVGLADQPHFLLRLCALRCASAREQAQADWAG